MKRIKNGCNQDTLHLQIKFWIVFTAQNIEPKGRDKSSHQKKVFKRQGF